MLRELRISNFAIIDSLNIAFSEGLNILTGETGAGKSIIVGALSLLLGGRASADMIRSAEQEAVVEAIFDNDPDGPLAQKLEGWGISSNDCLLVKRVVSQGGKSRAYINGGGATLQMLSHLGTELIGIAGQREHQTLLQVERHCDILDEFGGLGELRDQVTAGYRRLVRMSARARELESLEGEKVQRAEFLRFQIREIEQVSVKEGEEEALREERKILTHAQKLMDLAGSAYQSIYAGQDAGIERLREALLRLKEIAAIDASMTAQVGPLETAFYQAEDVARSLQDYLHRIHCDQGRLEAVEARLNEIGALKKKYGSSVEELNAYRDRARGELEQMESNEAELAGLRQEQRDVEEKVLALALTLSRQRAQCASRLSDRVTDELASLGMKSALFKVGVERSEGAERGACGEAVHLKDHALSAKGLDTVEFFFGPNPGEGLMPLARIVSGGELSRLVLALKKIVSGTNTGATLVFDEVDSGMGGAVAEVVGRKLKEIAGCQQTICITHLAQIATFADQHHSIAKQVRQGRTITLVKKLDSLKEREDEVARMLGGTTITAKTREHAREMLRIARRGA